MTDNTAMVSLADFFKSEIATFKESPQSRGDVFIRAQDGEFVMPDMQSGQTLECVILDFRYVNQYYKGAYNPALKAPPLCQAIGKVTEDMVPSELSDKIQATGCAICPHYQWGDDGSRPKCKQQARIAVIPSNSTNAEDVALINLPPTSLKPFEKYKLMLTGKFGLWLTQMVTTISLDDKVPYPKYIFTAQNKVDDVERFGNAFIRAQELLDTQYGLLGKKN